MGRWRPLAAGVGAGSALALPAALVAQLLDAVLDDGLPGPGAVLLAVLAGAGALVGAAVAARSGAPPRRAVLTGPLVLGVVAALGLGRRGIAGDALHPEVLLAALVVGAALGWVGAVVGSGRTGPEAARTRP